MELFHLYRAPGLVHEAQGGRWRQIAVAAEPGYLVKSLTGGLEH
ncbi:MAG: hypothetical protein ACUVSV_10230 [Armatimonadota bacterium]